MFPVEKILKKSLQCLNVQRITDAIQVVYQYLQLQKISGSV